VIDDLPTGVWDRELNELFLRIGARFTRVEPRRRMRDYVRGLLGPVGRKNSWQLAEYAGHPALHGLQHLLSWSRWDADAVRDDLQAYVAEQLGHPDGALIIVDTGFVEEGHRHDVLAAHRRERARIRSIEKGIRWGGPALMALPWPLTGH